MLCLLVLRFDFERLAADDEEHLVAFGCDDLAYPTGEVTKAASQRSFRHEAHADFVGDKNDGSAVGARGPNAHNTTSMAHVYTVHSALAVEVKRSPFRSRSSASRFWRTSTASHITNTRSK